MPATTDSTSTNTGYMTCPLCEATCGLEIETRGREVISIRGDARDVFSQGYICPKAASLKEMHTDPDRIREPMVRRGEHWQQVSWDDAFAEIERGLMPVLQAHGRDALAVYAGNPNVHNLSNLLYLPVLLHAARTRNFYSASTVDQMPKQVSAALMFGTGLTILSLVGLLKQPVARGCHPERSEGSACGPLSDPSLRSR